MSSGKTWGGGWAWGGGREEEGVGDDKSREFPEPWIWPGNGAGLTHGSLGLSVKRASPSWQIPKAA